MKKVFLALFSLIFGAAAWAQTPTTLPFSCGFDDSTAISLWSYDSISGTNLWATGTAISSNTCMYVSNDHGISNAYSTGSRSVQIAYTRVLLPLDSSYYITYRWRCYGETNCDFLRIALIPDTIDISHASSQYTSYCNTLPQGWIAIDGGNNSRQSSWQHALHTAQADSGIYKLALIWVNDGSGGLQPPAAVDDIVLKLVTCPAPRHLRAYSTTTDSATVVWDAGTASEWLVEYGPQGFSQGSGQTAVANTPSYTLGGLSASTTYDIYVRSICSIDDTGLISSTAVTTSCYENGYSDFPFIEDFENGISCWNQTCIKGSIGWQMTGSLSNGTASYQGSRFARFEDQTRDSNSTMLVSPILNFGSDTGAIMTFAHIQPNWANDVDMLTLVYRTHPDSTWHTLLHWADAISQWQVDTIVLPNTTNTYQIGFIAVSGYGRGVGIDDIRIYGPGSSIQCDVPVVASVTPDERTATIVWTGSGDAYQLAVKPASDTLWQDSIETELQEYTFSGLRTATNYNYRIRTRCDIRYTDWVEGSFKTTGVGIDLVDDPMINVFPNPSDGHISIAMNGMAGTKNIRLVDITGRTIMLQTTASESCEISHLDSGCYFVIVTDSEGNTHKTKLIVK